MAHYKLILGAILTVSALQASATNNTFSHCTYPFKPIEKYGNSPLVAAADLLKTTKNKTYRTYTVLSYLRQGEPAGNLVRLNLINKQAITLNTRKDYSNQKKVAITMIKPVSPNETLQIRAAGPIKSETNGDLLVSYGKNNPRSYKPKHLHFYVMHPTWMKFSYLCAGKAEKKPPSRATELYYTLKNKQWTKTNQKTALDHYQKLSQ